MEESAVHARYDGLAIAAVDAPVAKSKVYFIVEVVSGCLSYLRVVEIVDWIKCYMCTCRSILPLLGASHGRC